MCNKDNHNLIEIFTDNHLMCEHVVRWCQDCGAVVVDKDIDGEIRSGAIMKMKFPTGKSNVI